MAAAAVGDLASVKWAVTLADGKPLPQQGQVFDQGDVRMVVGAGGFLPCLHKKVAGMSVGDKASVDVAPADAFGESNPMMGPVDIPAAQAPAGLEAGMLVQLATGQKARVTQVTADAVTIDANMPLAGAALKMDVELLAVEAGAASLEKADFALGCFWGAELAFQREKGVVSTKVGYTQGAKESPTYEEVCSGTTGHTECVQVLFDPKEVSFERLCALFWERLGNDRFKPNQVGNDRGTQYRHGIYYHSQEQQAVAEASLQALVSDDTPSIATEIKEAGKFWDAEEYHMQYLQKGGQDARKAATETIRCYG